MIEPTLRKPPCECGWDGLALLGRGIGQRISDVPRFGACNARVWIIHRMREHLLPLLF